MLLHDMAYYYSLNDSDRKSPPHLKVEAVFSDSPFRLLQGLSRYTRLVFFSHCSFSHLPAGLIDPIQSRTVTWHAGVHRVPL
jgi:hypothetical protein